MVVSVYQRDQPWILMFLQYDAFSRGRDVWLALGAVASSVLINEALLSTSISVITATLDGKTTSVAFV